MSDNEFKIKAVVEWEVDEKQLEDTWKKAWEYVQKWLKEQKISLKAEKKDLERDLKDIQKTIDWMVKEWNTKSKIYFQAQLEKDEFENRLKEVNSQIDDLNNKIEKWFNVNAFWHLLSSWIFDKIWNSVLSLWKKVLWLWDSAQQAQISFTTMLWSVDKAKDLLEDLSEFASKTPFELGWIRDSAKQLLAMGVQAKDMIPTLKSLWDVSAGLNVPLERLALNYGQVLTQGKLTWKELKDFTTAWVPLIDELSKNLNKSKTEIQDMVSQWKISADDMVKAFESMTNAWWRFANLMEEQSKTLWWLISNLEDEVSLTGEVIGEQLVPTASVFVEWLWKIVWWIREWVQENPKLTSAIATFVWVVWWLIALWWTLAGVITLLTASFWSLALPILWVVAAAGALTAGGIALRNYMHEQDIQNKYSWETYESLKDKIEENSKALDELNKKFEEWKISAEEYEEAKKSLQDEEWELKEALDLTSISADEVRRELERIRNSDLSLEDKIQALEWLRKKANQTAEALHNAWEELQRLWAKMEAEKKEEEEWMRSSFWAWWLVWDTQMQYNMALFDWQQQVQENEDLIDSIWEVENEIDSLNWQLDKTGDNFDNTFWWWWKSAEDSAKKILESKKKLLKEERDLKIKEVQQSNMSEEEKWEAILKINDDYKDKLYELEKWETENVIKESEKQLKAKEEQYKKEISYYEDLKKITDKVDSATEKHRENVEKLGDEWAKVKDKARDSLREVNNSIKELDDDFWNDLVERYSKVKEEIKKARWKEWASWIMDYADLDFLLNYDWSSINWIDIDKAIEYRKLVLELEDLEKNLTEEQKQQAEVQDRLTETEKKRLEYEKERAVLVEKSKMLEAISDSWDWNEQAKIRYKDDSKEQIEYFDKTKEQWVEITDFKNEEYARDVLDNQEKLAQKKLDLDTALEDELKAYGDQVLDIKKKYEDDTKNYKIELDNKKKAFAQYVQDMNALASQLSSRVWHNAYWGNLLEWSASWVWENGPEQIIARQSSYVQPRNAVNNNSTIYNNQSSLSINGLEIWNMNSVDDLLDELRNRLTYRH